VPGLCEYENEVPISEFLRFSTAFIAILCSVLIGNHVCNQCAVYFGSRLLFLKNENDLHCFSLFSRWQSHRSRVPQSSSLNRGLIVKSQRPEIPRLWNFNYQSSSFSAMLKLFITAFFLSLAYYFFRIINKSKREECVTRDKDATARYSVEIKQQESSRDEATTPIRDLSAASNSNHPATAPKEINHEASGAGRITFLKTKSPTESLPEHLWKKLSEPEQQVLEFKKYWVSTEYPRKVADVVDRILDDPSRKDNPITRRTNKHFQFCERKRCPSICPFLADCGSSKCAPTRNTRQVRTCLRLNESQCGISLIWY